MSEQHPQDPSASQQPPQYGTPPPAPQVPPQNPYQPYGTTPGYSATGAPMWVPDHPKATTVLILGILGMAVCQILAPVAWVMGSRVKKEIEASGGRYAGSSQVTVGWILGIVGTVLMILGLLFFILYLVVVVIAIGASA
ncbi:DUF4190 domain-containing protein [Nocardioides stalactiti]|uniref:DUF4190 domain-containing protein n=1 Tax=Nocardioides stalactiti TaxID=2755356 RepID=UPI001C7F4696|nr:DUF4190 domain-containing protein [Nocardioides stalactiti]